MSDLLRKKLKRIQANLMSGHDDSAGFASAISGAEREIVYSSLLSSVLPQGHRASSGAIIDSTGLETGQVDLVVEGPRSISFPVASERNRLFIAATVVAAFEIKSDLNAQRMEAIKKVEEIRRLKRFSIKKDDFVMFDRLQIPTFIVGYKGPTDINTLEKNFISRSALSPNGVLSIDTSLFIGRSPGGDWRYAQGPEAAIFAFLSCLVESLEFYSHPPDFLSEYLDLVVEK